MDPWVPAAPVHARPAVPPARARRRVSAGDGPEHADPAPRARRQPWRAGLLHRGLRGRDDREPPWAPAAVRRRVAELVAAGTGDDVPAAAERALREAGCLHAADALTLADGLAGFGPLAPWVRSPGVTDVLVAPDGQVWTDGADGLVRRPLSLPPDEARALAVRLVTQAGRRLDPAVPLADARLHGVRVHAVLPPVSAGGAVLSLRVPAAGSPGLDALARGWPDGARWLEAVEELVAGRATVLVAGATGSGKTTLLSAALGRVPADERIVLLEDTREAEPEHPHVVALQTRPPNAEGAGAVEMAELIRQSLRMRPDRLVVGECRGAEVADLLTALNTGHQGAWGTLHANGPDDVPARLTAMGSLAGWPPAAVASQVRAGVDAVLHVRRDRHGRHPVALAVPDRPSDPAAPLRMVRALTWQDGRSREGPGLGRLRERLEGRTA